MGFIENVSLPGCQVVPARVLRGCSKRRALACLAPVCNPRLASPGSSACFLPWKSEDRLVGQGRRARVPQTFPLPTHPIQMTLLPMKPGPTCGDQTSGPEHFTVMAFLKPWTQHTLLLSLKYVIWGLFFLCPQVVTRLIHLLGEKILGSLQQGTATGVSPGLAPGSSAHQTWSPTFCISPGQQH